MNFTLESLSRSVFETYQSMTAAQFHDSGAYWFVADEIPEILQYRHRKLSLRGYGAEALMVDAEVVEGGSVGNALSTMFENSNISYVHIHNALPGCFNCVAVRSD